MNATSLAGRVEIVADEEGLTSRAGTALLVGVADRTGLTDALGVAMRGVRSRVSRHCPGRSLRDVAVMLADGGDALFDLRVLRAEASLFGAPQPRAQTTTIARCNNSPQHQPSCTIRARVPVVGRGCRDPGDWVVVTGCDAPSSLWTGERVARNDSEGGGSLLRIPQRPHRAVARRSLET